MALAQTTKNKGLKDYMFNFAANNLKTLRPCRFPLKLLSDLSFSTSSGRKVNSLVLPHPTWKLHGIQLIYTNFKGRNRFILRMWFTKYPSDPSSRGREFRRQGYRYSGYIQKGVCSKFTQKVHECSWIKRPRTHKTQTQI